jgi:hypothetical protein
MADAAEEGTSSDVFIEKREILSLILEIMPGEIFINVSLSERY